MEHNRNGGHLQTYYVRSTDSGVTWDAEMQITNDSRGTYSPFVSAEGNNVYVVCSYRMEGLSFDVSYLGRRNSYIKVYVAVSTDSGVSFGPGVDITNTTGVSESYPELRSEEENLYVAYITNELSVQVMQSTDLGATWSAPYTVVENTTIGDTWFTVCLAVQNGQAFLTWPWPYQSHWETYFASAPVNATVSSGKTSIHFAVVLCTCPLT